MGTQLFTHTASSMPNVLPTNGVFDTSQLSLGVVVGVVAGVSALLVTGK